MSSIKYTCLTALSLSLSCQVMAQTSPNGKIKAILDEGDEVEVEYKNGGKWIDLFSIDTKAMKTSKARKVTVDYEMLTGKRLHPTNQYRESDYLDSLWLIFIKRVLKGESVIFIFIDDLTFI